MRSWRATLRPHWTKIVLAVAVAVVAAIVGTAQVYIYIRQADIMNTQAQIAKSQTCSNILRYGGVPDGLTDNAAAWDAALAAAPTNHPCIYLPSGDYSFSSQCVYTLSLNDQIITIVGDGPDTTTLRWPDGGGILANRTAFHVRDIAILGGSVNTGIGFDAEWGVQHTNHTASSTMDRVRVSGTSIGTNYWATGIKINGVSQVNLHSIDIYGQHSLAAPVDGTGNTAGSIGLDLEAPDANLSFIYNILNSSFFGSTYGLKYGSNVQGVAILNTNFTVNFNGIYVPVNSVNQSELSVTNSQFNNGSDSILLDTGSSMSGMSIVNNLFFVESNTSGIHLNAPNTNQFITITSNQFYRTTTSIGTVGIKIDGSNAVAQNIINDTLCALLQTCVQLGRNAWDWRVSNTRCTVCFGTGNPCCRQFSARLTNAIG